MARLTIFEHMSRVLIIVLISKICSSMFEHMSRVLIIVLILRTYIAPSEYVARFKIRHAKSNENFQLEGYTQVFVFVP